MENTPRVIEEKNKARKSAKDKKIEELEKRLEENNKTLESLKSLIEVLTRTNTISSQNDESDKREVLVGSRSLYPLIVGTADGHISYTFNYDEIHEIEARELKDIFKNDQLHTKDLFRKGVLYFVDEKEYANFRIKDFVSLDKDFYKYWLVERTPNEAIEEFKRITNDKQDFIALHQLVYGIGYILMSSNVLQNWKYESRVAIENYFGKKMEDIIVNIQAYERRPNKR